MSASIRHSNLFSAEDYKKVFKAYAFIDYSAYDYSTLKQALLNYIQTYHPEDFNDYIESSEFVAIVELLAYFGTSLAFRTDINSRENFIDTAERRESVIRLAQMVNYVPRRNVPASGLFKIAAVETNQPMTDSSGVDINGTPVFWNDPNNPDWFDQFVQICNASFSTLNPFGRPTKSGTIGSIPTDLYQLNNMRNLAVAYPVSININGQQYPVDVCNPDFVSGETIFERDPDPAEAFNFIYRNDSLGVASANTGFFLYFKQGTLINLDTHFDFPEPNRLHKIDIQNINQDDVYVQETDEGGNVITKWTKVAALAGENIIYNSIHFAERNIFDVITGANDTISIRFADGNFGNVPTGLFRAWVRTSANQALVIRPDNAQHLQIAIPYIGADQQTYQLKIVFSLEQTIGNAAPSETDEQIRLRAPEVFSTQSRMVNGSDYNVLPLVYGNQITKLQALNRTYSGNSRYIDLNDPTGFHRDLLIFGQDGALYKDTQNVLSQLSISPTSAGSINAAVLSNIKTLVRHPKVSAFFYDEYLSQFDTTIRVNKQSPSDAGYSILDFSNPHMAGTNQLLWTPSPAKYKNDTGYFVLANGNTATLTNSFNKFAEATGRYLPFGMIKSGAVLEILEDTGPISASVNTVIQNGINLESLINPYATVGPVELGREVKTRASVSRLIPAFRTAFKEAEIDEINSRISAGVSFWIFYDLLTDTWGTSVAVNLLTSDQSKQTFKYAPAIVEGGRTQIYSDWANSPASGLIYVTIASTANGDVTIDLTARGNAIVFESYRDVRFYWEPNQVIIDNASGIALQDTIELMPYVNTNSSVDNNNPVITNPTGSFLKTPVSLNITGIFVQEDGYRDASKVEVSLSDTNNDGIADDPSGFNKIVSPTNRVVFEYYTNEVTGYRSTRPWIAKWATSLANHVGDVYVYFPTTTLSATELYSAPIISSLPLNNPAIPSATPGAIVVYMDQCDLLFVNNAAQVASIASQITSFFNAANSIENKIDIITANFVNKSVLLSQTAPGFGEYKTFEFVETSDPAYPANRKLIVVADSTHFDKNGKTFTQNSLIDPTAHVPMHFKWSHYSPVDQRVDPAATNIIDMIVITESYYRDMTIWKNTNGTISTLPTTPTTEELRIQFQDLAQYKMVSDSMVWNSGKFKLLFGPQAETELQATFKVVKSPNSSASDNEVKTKVVQAIDDYFDIRNWDFGEKFFYTELAAFIHQQLSKIISSVVIVPNNASSQFGNLFEIDAGPTNIFMSTATVSNVHLVTNLSESTLRA